MPGRRSWNEVIGELEARVEASSGPDEVDAAKGALEEAKRQRGEERRTPMGPPMLATSERFEAKDWPPGNFVLGGRDHGSDVVELRARHVERGALIEARQTLSRLRIVAREFEARVNLAEMSVEIRSRIATGLHSIERALADLGDLEIESAETNARDASRDLSVVAKAKVEGLSEEAYAAQALRSVSMQVRRSAAQLRIALAMRNLTHEEARILHETTALDVAAMLQAHASDGMRFVYEEGFWSVHGVPGTVICAAEFGSALAQALTRLRRA